MNKIMFIFVLFYIRSFGCLYGQELIVQSNNVADLKQYEQLTRATSVDGVKTKLERVVRDNPDYGNSKILIQITFFDPSVLGYLRLKGTHVHGVDYVNVWKTAYAAEDRILFLFEKHDKRYVFKDFVVTQNIENGQIPDIVVNYIKEQILLPENNDVAKIVYKGLNAVKNAYDRSFQKKLVDVSDKMIKEKRYYKGYTYTAYEYYTLERETNTNILPYDFCDFYTKAPSENYIVVNPEPFQSAKSTLAAVLTQKSIEAYYATSSESVTNKYYFHPKTDELYVKNNHGAFVKYFATGYTKDYYIYAENNAGAIFNAQTHINNIIETPYAYTGWERKKINGSWTQGLIFDSTRYYCDQQYRVVYRKGMFSEAEQIDETGGFSRWPNFQEGQPTWCNQFARNLTKEMYGDFVMGSMSANELFNFFTTSKDYVGLMKTKEKDENNIWKQYVDKGFLVFYSKRESGTSGHIETCFPNVTTGNKTQQKRHSEDFRYQDDNTPRPAGSNTNLFVGAGTFVGYKYSEDWRSKKETTPFLYLGFLKIEIN